jgi:aryl-alcohol dehydrogenase-like predicted oxidoreductase
LLPSLLTLSDVFGTGHPRPSARDLGLEFGATEVVAERGDEGIARVRELTGRARSGLRPHRQPRADPGRLRGEGPSRSPQGPRAALTDQPFWEQSMEHRPLGRTGVSVSKLCLGTMMFGDWGTKDHDESIKIINRALDAGINFVDTADVYSAGESEQIVKALAGRRADIVLATKAHMPMGDDPNHRGNSRRWIVREVEDSLRRLGTDWIDLYQIHRWDPAVDLDETLGALTDLVRSGKVRYIGHSTFPPSTIVAAQWTAEKRGRERFVTEQPPYSMLVRNIENEVLPVAQRYGMGVIPYSPLGGGWLSGRYRKDAQDGPMSAARQRLANRFDLSLPENQRKLDAVEQLSGLADDAGLTLIELAIAFVLRHPAITAPIIGPRTMEHLESQLAAADVVLTEDVLDRIDAIVPPGVTINPAENGWVSPSLRTAARRR